MNTNQERKLNMYLAVRNFINSNQEVIKDLPNFSASQNALQDIISQIQSYGELQKQDKKGITIEKKKLKKSLITIAGDSSRKIAALAKFSNNDTLLSEVRFNDSDLAKMTDVALKDYGQIIYDKVKANLSALGEYGITEESQKIFTEILTAYNGSLSKPRSGIAERRQATKQLEVLFVNADAIIEKMDYSAGIVKLTQPTFFNGYRTVRKLIETGSGNLSLKASAKDQASGKPVSGVIFKFRHDEATGKAGANGELTKKTAEKGSFYIKNMPSGTYRVTVSKPGYKMREVNVSIAEGERSELKVELEKA
jgi:hypothetical protein